MAAIVRAVRLPRSGTMINSANTKRRSEGMYIYGMDYRRVASLGVDYLVVETVAANLALINGGYERHFDFSATLAEMKAFVPEMKLIFLHGLKDVCESYDLMRHAPSRLEREVYTLANQMRVTADGDLERCASGFMVCLGDGLTATEWAYLRRQWHTAYSFDRSAPVNSPGCLPTRRWMPCWKTTPPGARGPAFQQIAELVEHRACRCRPSAASQT